MSQRPAYHFFPLSILFWYSKEKSEWIQATDPESSEYMLRLIS